MINEIKEAVYAYQHDYYHTPNRLLINHKSVNQLYAESSPSHINAHLLGTFMGMRIVECSNVRWFEVAYSQESERRQHERRVAKRRA